jgi:hypothetical protein
MFVFSPALSAPPPCRDRINAMSAQPLDIRMAHLEGVYEQLDKRLGDLTATVESRFAQVDSRFAQMDSRFGQVESRLDNLGQKVDGLQWRLTSLIVVTWVTTILAVLLRH